VEAIFQAELELGGIGCLPEPALLARSAAAPRSLLGFEPWELEEATRFILRMGFGAFRAPPTELPE
jgi:hypothetical protein